MRDIPLCGALYDELCISEDIVPPIIETGKGKWLNRRHDMAHRLFIQRNQVWIAVHKADKAMVDDNPNRIAGEERALALWPRTPVQGTAAGKVSTTANHCHAGQDFLRFSIPEANRRVWTHDPGLVCAMQINGRIKSLAPFNHRRVEMRVRDSDGFEAAQAFHQRNRGVIQMDQAIPQHIALLGLKKKGAVLYRKGWRGLDGCQRRGQRHEAVGVFTLHLCQRGPLLPLWANILAIVLADGAASRFHLLQGILRA